MKHAVEAKEKPYKISNHKQRFFLILFLTLSIDSSLKKRIRKTILGTEFITINVPYKLCIRANNYKRRQKQRESAVLKALSNDSFGFYSLFMYGISSYLYNIRVVFKSNTVR